MQINKININNYGNLSNKEINLDNKINIIYGKNEAGKSTLLNFIESMFFGANKNKGKKLIPDFDRYNPWNNGEYSNAELIVNNTSQDTSARIYSKGFHVIDKSKSNNNNQITLGYSYETNGNRNYPLLRFTNVYNNNLDNNDYCTISAYSIQLYNANGNHTTITQNGITTPTLTQTSKAELKKNFEKLENALDIINKTDIYKYNLKNEEDTCKKHIGLVIGDNYKYSKEITSNKNDSVDLYSMISVCFKAIQEQQKQIETLQTKIEKLEKEVK